MKTAQQSIHEEIETRRNEPGYEYEVLLLEMNQQLSTLMDQQAVRKSDLADKLGVSRAYVTKLLRGETNVTLRTLVHCANALEAKVSLRLTERTSRMRLVTELASDRTPRVTFLAVTKGASIAQQSLAA